MQDGTVIVVGDNHQRLIDTAGLAQACESEDQRVIDFLGEMAERGGIAAYNAAGEAMRRANLTPDDDGYYPSFYVDLNGLKDYFGRGYVEDSDLADEVERVLDQI